MAIVTSGRFKFSRDFVPSGTNQSAELWIEFAAAMTAAGWIAVDFSDGTTVTTSTTPATFAQLDNSNAWQRFRAPTGTFEVVWQRGTSDWLWRAFFDMDGFNNDGTATVLPTESAVGARVQIVGSSGSTTTWTWQSGGAQNYKWQLCVDSVPSPGGFYYFHMVGRSVGTAVKFRRFIFAPLKSGTYSPSDVAPWVALRGTNASTISDNTSWWGWYKKGLASAALVETILGNNDGPFPSTGVVNPYDGKHDFQRVMFDDGSGTEQQTKGRSIDCFWTPSSLTALPDADTVNLSTAWGATAESDPGALYRFDEMLIPFPDGTAPVP